MAAPDRIEKLEAKVEGLSKCVLDLRNCLVEVHVELQGVRSQYASGHGSGATHEEAARQAFDQLDKQLDPRGSRRLALALMTNGHGQRAERLVLWRDSSQSNLGGWGFKPLEERLDAALASAREEGARARGEELRALKDEIETWDGGSASPEYLAGFKSCRDVVLDRLRSLLGEEAR